MLQSQLGRESEDCQDRWIRNCELAELTRPMNLCVSDRFLRAITIASAPPFDSSIAAQKFSEDSIGCSRNARGWEKSSVWRRRRDEDARLRLRRHNQKRSPEEGIEP